MRSICKLNLPWYQQLEKINGKNRPARPLRSNQLRATAHMSFRIDYLDSYDHDSIAAELRRIAALLNKNSVSRRDIDTHGRLNSRTVMIKFGTLRRAIEAAGLTPSRFTKATDRELLQIVASLWTITQRESNRSPLSWELRKYGFPLSARTIATRFGSWNKALTAAANFLPNSAPSADTPPAPTRERQSISMRKRFLVFKRDLYTCQICKQAGGILELDHILPHHHGGTDRLENLQTLCRPCNQGKSSSLQ